MIVGADADSRFQMNCCLAAAGTSCDVIVARALGYSTCISSAIAVGAIDETSRTSGREGDMLGSVISKAALDIPCVFHMWMGTFYQASGWRQSLAMLDVFCTEVTPKSSCWR